MINLAGIKTGQTDINAEFLLEVLSQAESFGYKVDYLEVINQGEGFRIFWVKL